MFIRRTGLIQLNNRTREVPAPFSLLDPAKPIHCIRLAGKETCNINAYELIEASIQQHHTNIPHILTPTLYLLTSHKQQKHTSPQHLTKKDNGQIFPLMKSPHLF